MNNREPTATVLAIDTGSTRTHLAVVDIEALACTDRFDFDNSQFNETFASSIRNIISKHQNIRTANISSCVRELETGAKNICEETGAFDYVRIIKAHDELPVSFNYENPQKLGGDRICNALACAALFGNKRNCIIIDSGTAVTVDCLRGGKVFEGGAILPGIAMQARALYGQTDALPFVNMGGDSKDAIVLPAASTEKCIRAGVVYGSAGAVEKCVMEYLRIYGNDDVKIAATGGGWKVIEPFVCINREITTVPDLTLIGAGVFCISASQVLSY